MSTSPLIQLSADELATALGSVEPIDVVAQELVTRATCDQPQPADQGVRLARWRGRTAPSSVPGTEWVVLEDLRTGPLCVLPLAGLMASRAAALTGLAARTLLGTGPVTVAVLGAAPAVRPQMVVTTHHLRGVGRIAVWPARDGGASVVESSLLDEIDLAGIGFVVAAAVADAVDAANLVVAVEPVPLAIGQLTKGAVVVNAAGRGWSAGLVGAVDQLYVDDATQADRDTRALHGRPIDADLGQLLAGRHPGRTDRDHIVLVELLGRDVLDVQLAASLHRVALERALGTRLPG